jgi:peroxiredoxin
LLESADEGGRKCETDNGKDVDDVTMNVKQVKIFPAVEAPALEKRVNEFLMKGEASDIYEIKFVCVSAEQSGKYQYSCLVVYQVEAQPKQA